MNWPWLGPRTALQLCRSVSDTCPPSWVCRLSEGVRYLLIARLTDNIPTCPRRPHPGSDDYGLRHAER
jgi:hypothetical protein